MPSTWGTFTVVGNDEDDELAIAIWRNYEKFQPLQDGLPRPEENHVRIRGLLRQAINHDGMVQVSRSLFIPHLTLQLVLMLSENRQGDYERVYFLAYKEGYPIEQIYYRGRRKA